MNSPGAIGAGGAVRPFFNKSAGSAPPTDITLYDLGAFDSTAYPIVMAMAGPFSLSASSTLIVAITYNNNVLVDSVVGTFAGDAIPSAFFLSFNAGNNAIQQWSFPMNGTPRSGSVVFDFTGSTDFPQAVSLHVMKAALLLQAVPPANIDRTKQAGGSSGNQDSGLSAITLHAHDLLVGTIGTNGTPANTEGAWTAPLTHFARNGTAQTDLKIGSAVVNATAQYRSQVTGATSRPYGSMLVAYRGA